MSRVAKGVLLGGLVLGIVASTGCSVQGQVTAKSKTRFTESNVGPSSEPSEPWAGEKIVVRDESVGVVTGTALTINVDPSATKVTATAQLVASAANDEEANAKLSIVDAKATFKIVKEGDVWNVVCGHGASHGTSNGGESGCNNLVVTIPAGSDAQKIALDALCGNGDINIDVSAATLENLGVNGKNSDITVRAPTTKGANISVVGEENADVTVLLPSSFAADKIELFADPDKIVNNVGDLQLTDTTGGKTGSRGTAGEGAASVRLTSKEFAGSTNTVTLGTF
jgi:hypothetical protein